MNTVMDLQALWYAPAFKQSDLQGLTIFQNGWPHGLNASETGLRDPTILVSQHEL